MCARLKTTLITKNSPEAALAQRLYEASFPQIERIDFSLLLSCAENGRADFFAYSEKGQFVGFAFVLLPKRYAYLLFCAIEPEQRSRGLGACMIRKLRRRYPERTIVLDIEPLSDTAENSGQRRRRYMFYVNNGFRDTGYEMRDITGIYRILSSREGLDISAFTESYSLLPEIFEGTEIYRDGTEEPVFRP